MMIAKVIWALIVTAISVGLFQYSKYNYKKSYGFDALLPYIPAYIFALICAGLWLLILSSLVPIWPIVYGISVACFVAALLGIYPAIEGVPYWFPAWLSFDEDVWAVVVLVGGITGGIGLTVHSGYYAFMVG